MLVQITPVVLEPVVLLDLVNIIYMRCRFHIHRSRLPLFHCCHFISVFISLICLKIVISQLPLSFGQCRNGNRPSIHTYRTMSLVLLALSSPVDTSHVIALYSLTSQFLQHQLGTRPRATLLFDSCALDAAFLCCVP